MEAADLSSRKFEKSLALAAVNRVSEWGTITVFLAFKPSF